MISPRDHLAEDFWLAAIVESSDDAIIAKDLGGIIFSWNKAAERLFGYSAAEVIGQPVTVIFQADRGTEEEFKPDRPERGQWVDHYETDGRCKEGQIIRVSATTSLIRDANGTTVGTARILRDLTDRNTRDHRIQELQAELNHVQRLAEIGQVMSMLVHEINQPLAAINNYVSACRRLAMTGNYVGIQASLERIANQTSRAREIVQRIRGFVKKGDIQMRVEDISLVIMEAIELARSSASDGNVTLRMQVDPTELLVKIDKVQVQQVLFNLLRNGIEAMQDQPRHELMVAAKRTTKEMVEISVSDTGAGLPDGVRAKLFQPFVTTKADGMGVGLSVCRSIVESHEGRLWADDNPGGGTVFRFTVQQAENCPPAASERKA
jgi:two-component system, LuxR family, sensor kinase FixL